MQPTKKGHPNGVAFLIYNLEAEEGNDYFTMASWRVMVSSPLRTCSE
jgi:hypothetical protein